MATRRSAEATGGTIFRLFKGKHPPEEFLVPGQDTNGNSVRVYCRVVPLLDRAIDVLFASRRFPFKSKGDLMRWCLKRGVETLDEMEPCVGSVMAQVDAMMGILRDEQHNHAFLTVFQTAAVTIGMHVQAQAVGEAQRVVTVLRTHIEKIEDGYWRQRYLRELDEKFGYLLKGTKGAGLGDHADSGPDKTMEGIDED